MFDKNYKPKLYFSIWLEGIYVKPQRTVFSFTGWMHRCSEFLHQVNHDVIITYLPPQQL